jgi:CHAD domain-containing protein
MPLSPCSVDFQASGIRYWMERVAEAIDHLGDSLPPESIHDLRVSLRRCLQISGAMMALDPDKAWKSMRKDGRRLFRSLGDLRDNHVLLELICRLGPETDPVRTQLAAFFCAREEELKQEAMRALEGFDRRRWTGRIGRLQARTRSIKPGSAVFQLMALRCYEEAYSLHRQALRNRSDAAYHRLRIGLKKFRYTVENFLPRQHQAWGVDLKLIQDCLGEFHDLSLLWSTANRIRAFPDPESRRSWREILKQESNSRLSRYREKMVGPRTFWLDWRGGLPPASRLAALNLRLLEKWALFHGASIPRTQRIRRVALHLHDALYPRRQQTAAAGKERRFILQAALLLRAAQKGLKKRQREKSASVGDFMPALIGISAETRQMVHLVVRCQSSDFEGASEPSFAAAPGELQKAALAMGGILRLARALEAWADSPKTRIAVRREAAAIVILLENFDEFGPSAEDAARARHRLEAALGVPVLVKGFQREGG